MALDTPVRGYGEPQVLDRLEVVLAEVGHQRGHSLVADVAAGEVQSLERRQVSQRRGQRGHSLDAEACFSEKVLWRLAPAVTGLWPTD